jgi:hypothetical protein
LITKNEKISNVIEYWKNRKTSYFLLVKMTKNVLTMFYFNIEMKSFFNFVKDVIIYKIKWLNFHIIELMMMIKYNLNYDKKIDFFSFSTKYFANKLSANASQIFSFIMIENNINHLNDTNYSNKNSQSNKTALNKWNDKNFSKTFFLNEIQISNVCKLNKYVTKEFIFK